MSESILTSFERLSRNRWDVAGTDATVRRAKLRSLKRAIVESAAELEEAQMADLRKPAAEVAVSELWPVLTDLNHVIRHLPRWMRRRVVPTPLPLFGTSGEIRCQARGVVLVIAPWNYPFGLAIAPLVAAVAAGNCVVLKPSEKAPAVSRYLARLIARVFSADEVCVVEGGVAEAQELLTLPFDHFFFTGSATVGQIVMQAAAKHLSSVTLELGGKSPAFVDESGDVDAAAERIAWGKLINAGQTCIAPDYALVHAEVEHRFVEGLKQSVRRMYADPASSPDLCRMIDSASAMRQQRLIQDAVTRGARVELGGEVRAGDKFVAPTILTNVPADSLVLREEIFGPILPVVRYDSVDQAIARVRAGENPLALYTFASDEITERILRETTSGGVVVDNVALQYGNPNLPFGGVGASGLGSYHGEFGFRAFSHERAVLRQSRLTLISRFYPPYTARVRTLGRLLTKYLSW